MDYSGLTFRKDSREDAKKKREDAKAKRRNSEKVNKAKVVKRDGKAYCRLVPHCDERKLFETAHVNDKGMGGDHGLRSTPDQMLRGCFKHHRGNWSLHSGDVRVEWLTPDRANGPIATWGRDAMGRWYLLGRESHVGQWERD